MTPRDETPTPTALTEALALVRGKAADLDLTGCHVAICTPCLDGVGGECHTPGCLFWMCSAPDIPIRDRALDSNGYHIAEAIDRAHERGRQTERNAVIVWLRNTARADVILCQDMPAASGAMLHSAMVIERGAHLPPGASRE